MSYVTTSYQMSAATVNVGRQLHPRRYQRFPGLRSRAEAVAWARMLDWRENPYARFLLRRELLRFVTARAGEDPRHNVFRFANAEEVAATVDHMLNAYAEKPAGESVFNYVVAGLPWKLAIRAGRIRYSHLTKALAHQPTHAA